VLNEVYFSPRDRRIIRVVRVSLATITHEELPPEAGGIVRVENSRYGFLYEYSGTPLEPHGVMSNEQWERLASFLRGEEPEDLTEAERRKFAPIQRRLGATV